MPLVRRRTSILLSLSAVVASLAVASCGHQDSPAATSSSGIATHSESQHEASPPAGVALPSRHVHGVTVNPADGQVYLASHDGLFRMTAKPERVGPVINLMGFTVAGPDHFYASGHPGTGTDMPNLVGLIESRDGGRTWTALSRQGQSDFHALAAAATGVLGFDGALRASADGRSWTQLAPPVAPHPLAASPDGRVIVATSERGPMRSTDAGKTWHRIAGAPLLQLVDWADTAQLVAGVTPDGQIAVSTDAGATWQLRGTVDGPPQALGVSGQSAGSLRVLVVNGARLLDSTDGGATFPR
jgi:photosystem II stability/assembly factor-like uncharacterized protein